MWLLLNLLRRSMERSNWGCWMWMMRRLMSCRQMGCRNRSCGGEALEVVHILLLVCCKWWSRLWSFVLCGKNPSRWCCRHRSEGSVDAILPTIVQRVFRWSSSAMGVVSVGIGTDTRRLVVSTSIVGSSDDVVVVVSGGNDSVGLSPVMLSSSYSHPSAMPGMLGF